VRVLFGVAARLARTLPVLHSRHMKRRWKCVAPTHPALLARMQHASCQGDVGKIKQVVTNLADELAGKEALRKEENDKAVAFANKVAVLTGNLQEILPESEEVEKVCREAVAAMTQEAVNEIAFECALLLHVCCFFLRQCWMVCLCAASATLCLATFCAACLSHPRHCGLCAAVKQHTNRGSLKKGQPPGITWRSTAHAAGLCCAVDLPKQATRRPPSIVHTHADLFRSGTPAMSSTGCTS
jgi:hypothetical protein